MVLRRMGAALAVAGTLAGAGLVTGTGATGAAAAAPARVATSAAVSTRVPRCTGYTLFYDLTGTGNDYLNTSLSVCSNHTFTDGQGTGGTWKKSHKVYTFTYAPQDAVYTGKKTPGGFNSRKKPGQAFVGDGTGIWYATKTAKS